MNVLPRASILARWPLVLAPLACACGPSAVQLRAQELERQLEAMRLQVERQEERLTSLSNTVVLLSSASPRSDSAPGHAEVPRALSVVKLTPQRTETQVDESNEDDGEVIELSGDESGERLRVVKVAPLPPRPAGQRDAPKPSARPAAEDPATEREFGAALAAYREGKPKDALALFGAFLARYPKSGNVDDARYWMGECEFEQKSFLGAAEHYGRVVSDHPGSNKAAEALLKLGISYEKLGDERRARESFASLLQRFPSSAVADLARTRFAGPARAEVRP